MGFERKHTINTFIKIAEDRGGKCVSDMYTKYHHKLAFECSEGHMWEALPGNILSGHWCKICGNINQGKKKALSIDEMKTLAQQRGGLCLSNEYTNNYKKLKWQCDKGHIWETGGVSIKRGSWCPICAGKDKNENYRLIKKIAQERGGECLSDSYSRSKDKLKFRCSLGHEWFAIPDSIKRGYWCPMCNNLNMGSEEYGITIDFLKKIANNKGGKLLSTNYINSGEKLNWQCANGHIWKAPYDSVKQGSWCPICSSGLSESITRLFFEYITGKSFLKVRPKWLVNNLGKKLELDGYNEELGIAFEYQGIQHFKYIRAFHRDDDALKKRKEDDAIKRNLCSINNVFLIEVDYRVDKKDIFQFIINALSSHPQSSNIFKNSKEISYTELNLWKRDELIKLHNIAKERGGECLNSQYLGNDEKLKWKCDKGHLWMATPGNIKNGKWCPVCAGKDPDYYFELIKKIAQEKGGECISEKYIPNYNKLKFRCKMGHEWSATPYSIKSGIWCPVCGYISVGQKNSKYSLEHFQKLAKEKGGYCKSDSYKNTDSRLKFVCASGHEWETMAWCILKGHWCKKCSTIKQREERSIYIIEIKKLAKERGGLCLSEDYVNSREKLKWQCSNGHIWEASASNIKMGTWCPICRYINARKKF